MAWHTLAQAVKLTGRSRRSLYRDMDAGRLAYRVAHNGRREVDTAELLRAYGAFNGEAQEVAQPVAQVGTLAEVLEELRQLRQEVTELRQAMLLIEHKPEPPIYPAKKAESFADLLAGLAMID